MFDYGLWGWGDFPDSEESYIQSGKWYEHEPLENAKFSVLKANDSIKKLFPACDYYATDSISGKIYPIQIPHEVKNYQFIYRNDSLFKLKITYSIALEEDKKYHIWLEAIPIKNYGKLYLHYACRTIKERNFIIEIYKTIKMKD